VSLSNPQVWLRIAAVVALLQFAAHGTLFVRARPRHGPEEAQVVELMKTRRFDFAGAKRSYWDMYFGYGIFAAFFCLVEAVLFWQLAGAGAGAGGLVKSVALLFAVVNLAHIALVARFFFFVPAIPDAILFVALLMAWRSSGGG
jgi:hypothetical protein